MTDLENYAAEVLLGWATACRPYGPIWSAWKIVLPIRTVKVCGWCSGHGCDNCNMMGTYNDGSHG